MDGITERPMWEGRARAPVILRPAAARYSGVESLAGRESEIDKKLIDCGAILFRGFTVASVDHFNRLVAVFSERKIDYVYGSTPRTALGNRIFTSTEYPPALEISLHNENAYQLEWPLKLAFGCLISAKSGGETPIADMGAVTKAVGPQLVEKFRTLGVRYVRHYRPFLDLPWQKVFQTEDRGEVARFCTSNAIEFEWLDNDILKTVQVSQGTAIHPRTGTEIFFNQAHLFHVSSLGAQGAEALIEICGTEQLPRNAFYGDGQAIRDEELDAVRQAFRSAEMTFQWMAGDVLLLDNMQYAHGRRPFKGERKVVAALMDPHRQGRPGK